VLRKKSYGSVKTFWLDRQLALELALAACRRILGEREEVLRVGIFGSIARGNAVPGSDLDVLVLLARADVRPVDRSLPYVAYFDALGLPTDVLCFTEEEAASSPMFQRNAPEAIWLARDGDSPGP
jgi:predicted nucleotidyltransferase